MKLIHQISFIKRENGQVRYTFKTTVNDKTIYISGMNTEILELQKEYVEVFIFNRNYCSFSDLFSC